MKRMLLVAPMIAAMSIAASAATLSVNSDKLTYNVGETISLSIYGDNQGASAYSIYGRLLYNGALVNNGTRSQTTLAASSGTWTANTSLAAGDSDADGPETAFSEAFDQVNLVGDSPTNLPGTLSTVTLIAQAVGVVDVIWFTDQGCCWALVFFDLTSAPGTRFTIVEAVPEPSTAALFGLGLLALAAARRAGGGS
jgi:PEP-CTERM motif